MSSSSSKIPGIILGVIVVAILVAFYIVDRSSGGMSGAGYSGVIVTILIITRLVNIPGTADH